MNNSFPLSGFRFYLLGRQQTENRLLDMQPVFRLVKYRPCVLFESFIGDLLAAISGQTMHHQRARSRVFEQFAVDLVSLQQRKALFRFGFLAMLTQTSV